MKTLFGGLISVVLLGLYVHLVYVAIKVVRCVEHQCTEYPSAFFSDGMAQALAVIGGLVSALVIAELAITKPGEPPVKRMLAAQPTKTAERAISVVASAYVLIWIAVGLTAFIVGLYHPKAVPALTTLGQAWLGLAVSAAYAYFGLRPTNGV
jgi:hypothetical protein